MKAVLMNKRTPVLNVYGNVKYNIKEFNFPVFVADKIEVLNKSLCPIGIATDKTPLPSDEMAVSAFNYWIKKRLISDKRPDISKFGSMSVIWDNSHGQNPNYFSLSDQYWIKYNEKETWDELNFFHNKFNSTDGEIFFSKNIKNIKQLKFSYNSPDITTNGILPKKWKIIDGDLYLLKQAYLGYDQTPANEVLASRYLKALNIIPFVEYTFEIDGFTTCCKCKNFINDTQEFVPAIYIYDAINTNEQISHYEKIKRAIELFEIPDAIDFIDKMITVDRMLMNFDRHLGNFGFIRNVETGKFEGPAPLFDFGDAFLWNVAAQNKIESIENHHFFHDREKYLIRNKIINPVNDMIFDEDLKMYPGVTDEMIRNLNANVEKNNNYIKNIQNEHDKKLEDVKRDKNHHHHHHHKNKNNDKQKDKDKNQEVCIYF